MAHGWPVLIKSTTLLSGILLLSLSCPLLAQSNMAQPAPASAKTVAMGPLAHEVASTLVPATVFFAGQVAPIQMRNTGGAHLPGGLVLAGLVDTSGYSTGVQERYQAYLLLDTPIMLGGKRLGPGAYGCGFVNGQFLVLDLGAKELFHVTAEHDAALKRPTPLQVLADASSSSYRLYFGRSYVVFAAASDSK